MATTKTTKSGRSTKAKAKSSSAAKKATRRTTAADSALSESRNVGEVVAAELPGWKMVTRKAAPMRAMSTTADVMPTQVDATMPPIDELQKRYGSDSTSTTPAASTATPSSSSLNIVEVESAGLTKKIGLEGGKIKWSQG